MKSAILFCAAALGLGAAAAREMVEARSVVLSVEQIERALDQAGVTVGAGHIENGVGYKIERRQVSLDGSWIVIRILPKRFP